MGEDERPIRGQIKGSMRGQDEGQLRSDEVIGPG